MIMKKKGGLHIKFGKDHSSKNLTYTSVKRLLKRFKDSGTMNGKESSRRPWSATTEENTDLIEELICSEEEAPHAHVAPRKTTEQTRISRSSIRRMIKRRNFRHFKRLKTPEMNDGCRNRRYAHAKALLKKFERNTRMIEKTVLQR